MKKSGYSSGHSSDRMIRHERRTEDRDRSPLYSSKCRYEDKRSVSVGTVRFASVTILLMVIMTICLLSVRAASKLLDMVGFLNLCIEKDKFII